MPSLNMTPTFFFLNLDFTCSSLTVTTEKSNACSPWTSCFISDYIQTLWIGYIPKFHYFTMTSRHNIWNLLFTCKRSSWVFLNTKVLNLLHLGSVWLFAERFWDHSAPLFWAELYRCGCIVDISKLVWIQSHPTLLHIPFQYFPFTFWWSVPLLAIVLFATAVSALRLMARVFKVILF